MNIGKIVGYCSSCEKHSKYHSNPKILTTILDETGNKIINIFDKCEVCDLKNTNWLNKILSSGYTIKEIIEEWQTEFPKSTKLN
jgi:hypothetical protein